MVKIHVYLPDDRRQVGRLQLVDDNDEIITGPFPVLGKADNQAAAANGNPSRDPLRKNGDTPLGTYRVSEVRPTDNEHYPNHSYGPYGFLPLIAVSGQALHAAQNGRAGLGIHAGDPGTGGKLRPTYGCLRLFNDNQKQLVAALKNEGLPCECIVESTSKPSSITFLLESEVYSVGEDDGDVPSEPAEAVAAIAALEAFSFIRSPFSIDAPLKKNNSRLTPQLFDRYLDSRERTLLSGLGVYAIDAQSKYGINATYIVAHAIVETGWGTSRICIEKNNLFGWGAFDGTPYQSSKGFPSREICVDFVMGKINSLYLDPAGRYYRGAVLGNKDHGMNVYYASDPNWGRTIAAVAERIERFLDSQT
ncbi:glucosaminidase domain-containing protein [Gloeobacter kilaueensis]|uniref:Beta-N-acetylglucosaminidase n=1 Tax=Gloeobacter kilaueensis (strain ATCC BAA-2537 / CCAP 1431/1 / ULC 316 / JS1) TaxID=1183438 RepID=U5QNY9_GLOK1|nr:glucosaminidase domain-containing protein [Gloeobacter kilaueensis]AGY59294.1 beta- N-acetylglucosaminidase [Gloeobacter kilaueensis JS1]